MVVAAAAVAVGQRSLLMIIKSRKLIRFAGRIKIDKLGAIFRGHRKGEITRQILLKIIRRPMLIAAGWGCAGVLRPGTGDKRLTVEFRRKLMNAGKASEGGEIHVQWDPWAAIPIGFANGSHNNGFWVELEPHNLESR